MTKIPESGSELLWILKSQRAATTVLTDQSLLINIKIRVEMESNIQSTMVEQTAAEQPFNNQGDFEKHRDEKGNISVGTFHVDQSPYPEYLPTWNDTEHYKPLKFFKHEDKGKLADPNFPNLLPKDKVTLKALTPKFGSEIKGIQLSELGDAGKNEVALLAAQRGVLVFRDQDLFVKGPQYAKEYGSYFGPLHIHQTSGAPKGHPEIHVVYHKEDNQDQKVDFHDRRNKNSSVYWHSDVTYELQPPGTTFFGILEIPPGGGGDTLFADTVEAYNRLSPEFRKRLEGLKALHSSHDQAQRSRQSVGVVRRDPVNNIHPVVRVHPVTGQKSLFVNPNFTRKIVGFKEEESDALLEFLFNHIRGGHDFQLRASYEKDTVVIWDNRRVIHAAIFDWYDGSTGRHAVRVTPQAERPIEYLQDLNKEDVNNESGNTLYNNFY